MQRRLIILLDGVNRRNGYNRTIGLVKVLSFISCIVYFNDLGMNFCQPKFTYFQLILLITIWNHTKLKIEKIFDFVFPIEIFLSFLKLEKSVKKVLQLSQNINRRVEFDLIGFTLKMYWYKVRKRKVLKNEAN